MCIKQCQEIDETVDRVASDVKQGRARQASAAEE
jgi:hypothetical protein